MKNRMMVLLAFLAAFMLTSPAMAQPPTEDAAATDEKADDAKADEVKADDVKTDEAKADDAKTDDAKETSPEESGTDGTDAKADEKADAKAEISSDEEAMSVVKSLVDAAKGGQWSLAAAFALMLLVFFANKFGLKDKLGPKVVPWVAAGTSMAGYVAAALMVDGVAISDAVLGGFATGAAAVGLWEMLFKHVMGGKKEAPAEDTGS